MALRLKRGTTASLDDTTGAPGELLVDITKKSVRVMDGVTRGGHELLKSHKLFRKTGVQHYGTSDYTCNRDDTWFSDVYKLAHTGIKLIYTVGIPNNPNDFQSFLAIDRETWYQRYIECLDAAHAVGVKVLIHLDNADSQLIQSFIDRINTHPAIAGYTGSHSVALSVYNVLPTSTSIKDDIINSNASVNIIPSTIIDSGHGAWDKAMSGIIKSGTAYTIFNDWEKVKSVEYALNMAKRSMDIIDTLPPLRSV